MTDTTYNGWTNRETWLAALWISEGALGDLFDIGEQARYLAEQPNGDDTADYEMGKWFSDLADEIVRDTLPSSGMASDLLGTALAAINWTEIGKAYTDEARQNEREQTENAMA